MWGMFEPEKSSRDFESNWDTSLPRNNGIELLDILLKLDIDKKFSDCHFPLLYI
jgi:hypothetical protein